MPFVTEEIYHELKKRKKDDALCIKQFSPIEKPKKEILNRGEDLKALLSKGRDYKKESNLKQSEQITKLIIPKHVFGEGISIYGIIEKQLNIQEIEKTETEVRFPTLDITIYPFKNTKIGFEAEQKVDTKKKKEELLKDLEYHKGFLASVEKKLGNKRFIQNAKPEVVEVEKKKKADAEAKIRAIEESLAAL
jgi:valyl-tRNA synthetase